MEAHIIYSYKLNELPDDIQDQAIEKFREHNLDYGWYVGVYEDTKEIGRIIGLDITNIYFSGFWSQGDGACFEGSYSYKIGAVKNLKAYAPTDKELHRIAIGLSKIQRKYFYRISANIKHSGQYSHEYSTNIDVYCDGDFNGIYLERYLSSEDEETVKDLLRDFMRWIYKTLEKDYDFLRSDEMIKETIEANDYEFDEIGNLF